MVSIGFLIDRGPILHCCECFGTKSGGVEDVPMNFATPANALMSFLQHQKKRSEQCLAYMLPHASP